MSRPGKRARIAAAASFACLAGAVVGLAALSHGPPAPVWRFVALAIAAHVPYAVLVVLAWRGFAPRVAIVVGAAAGLRLALVFAHPVLSDDVYRYVWDGRVVAAGEDPYAYPPAAPERAAFRDDGFARINHPELRTIYPPLAELLFGAVARAWPSATAFQLVAALADLGVLALVIVVARARADGPAAALVGIAYGLNPLACIETAMSGHLEPLAVLPVVAAAALALRRADPGRRATGRRTAAAVALAIGACVKLVPLLLVAPAIRRLRLPVLIVPAAVVALYAAFWSPGLGAVRTLDAFARRWEGNAGGFAILKAGAQEVVGAAAGVARPDEMVHVPILDRPARALQGGFFSLHKDGGFDPERPGAFALSDLSLAIAKLASAAALLVVVAWVCRRRAELPEAALWIFGAFLLLTPVLHPWYALWILPWAACLGAWPWLAFGAALPLAYLPLDGWWARGDWCAPSWIPLVEYGVLAVAAIAWRLAIARLAGRARGPVDRQRR